MTSAQDYSRSVDVLLEEIGSQLRAIERDRADVMELLRAEREQQKSEQQPETAFWVVRDRRSIWANAGATLERWGPFTRERAEEVLSNAGLSARIVEVPR